MWPEMKPKVAMGQTEIPVDPAPSAKAELTSEDKEVEYARQMGEERADRQRSEWRRMYECNCGVVRGNHKIGCPKAE
jgi:hypothetical protein